VAKKAHEKVTEIDNKTIDEIVEETDDEEDQGEEEKQT